MIVDDSPHGCEHVWLCFWNCSSGDKPSRDTQSSGCWTETCTSGTHTQPFPRIPGSSHLHQDTSESHFSNIGYFVPWSSPAIGEFNPCCWHSVSIWRGTWLPVSGCCPLVRKCLSSLLTGERLVSILRFSFSSLHVMNLQKQTTLSGKKLRLILIFWPRLSTLQILKATNIWEKYM